jgi:aminoglycoside 2'-N-acetyltransferase I
MRVDLIATGDLDPAPRAAVIEVCNAANDSEAFGELFDLLIDGLHAIGTVGSTIVSHAVATTRWLQPDGMRELRTAYLDAVATEPEHQGKGYGSAVVARLGDAVADFDVGCLQTDITGFYARLGWEEWRGPLAGRDGDRRIPTPDQRGVMVLRLPGTPPLDLDAGLSIECQPRRIWE